MQVVGLRVHQAQQAGLRLPHLLPRLLQAEEAGNESEGGFGSWRIADAQEEQPSEASQRKHGGSQRQQQRGEQLHRWLA